MTPHFNRLRHLGLTLAAGALTFAGAAQADQVILDDLIVDGSICAGLDCVNGESFGFDTLRLKENNLRIKAQDTSSTASFPSNDWQITFNESSNGGANKFSVDDIDGSRTPFTIEAGARSNALYVESDGDIGIGTNNPAVDLTIVTGNTPTVRLQQDGTSGFTPQTWDVAGNEAGFFIRDATGGSTLPFRIITGGAPSQSLVIDGDGEIGMGAGTNPQDNLHIQDNDGEVIVRLDDGSSGDDLKMELDGDNFFITFDGTGGAEFLIRKNGQVEIGRGDLEVNNGHDLVLSGGGSVIVNGTTLNVPDYVFAADYELMPLDRLAAFIAANSHLPNVPSSAEVNAGGLDLTAMQMALLEKVEEQTLYTLQQQAALDAQAARIEALQAQLAAD